MIPPAMNKPASAPAPMSSDAAPISPASAPSSPPAQRTGTGALYAFCAIVVNPEGCGYSFVSRRAALGRIISA